MPKMPEDLDAERATLACLLLDNGVADQVFQFVAPAHAQMFVETKHRRIFEAISALQARADDFDVVHVRDELSRADSLDQAGGEAYLVELLESVATSASAATYAKRVRDQALRRRLLRFAKDIPGKVRNENSDIVEFLDWMEFKILDLVEGTIAEPPLKLSWIMEATDDASGESINLQRPRGLPTGFTNYDGLTGGLHRGELVVIAGRPSAGKTALALGIAAHLGISRDARLYPCHAPTLYSLLSAAYGASAGAPSGLPEGVLLDAPEQCRIALRPGDTYAFGMTLLRPDAEAATELTRALLRGLSRIANDKPDSRVPFRGNFLLSTVEDLIAATAWIADSRLTPLSTAFVDRQVAELTKARSLRLRFTSPLRMQRSAAQQQDGHRFFDRRHFDAELFVSRLAGRVARCGVLPQVRGRPEYTATVIDVPKPISDQAELTREDSLSELFVALSNIIGMRIEDHTGHSGLAQVRWRDNSNWYFASAPYKGVVPSSAVEELLEALHRESRLEFSQVQQEQAIWVLP